MPSCKRCSAPFEIAAADREILKRLAPTVDGRTFAIPDPVLCPDCRQQRRASHLNEMRLYKRPCDLTGKMLISNFHPKNPHTVYDQASWYSGAWDPLAYGRDFDFTRPFFEQYKELCDVVPYPALFTGYQYDENADYTNYAGKNKNCYLVFDSDENQDCYYSYSLNGSRNCLDCYRVRGSELCYECVDCQGCYDSAWLQECTNCSDSAFLYECVGCKHCLMCINLRNKEYCIENKQVTKEEFERYRKLLSSSSRAASARAHYEGLKLLQPHKHMYGVQNEDVSGEYLTGCKNARRCYDGTGLRDCAYMYRTFYPTVDSMDCEAAGGDALLYECSCIGYNAHGVLFSSNGLDRLANILYSSYVFRSSNLFGCVSMVGKQHCILNKQYAKEEYEKLIPKIIEHMTKTGEWGEFFPMALSPFAYNETIAQDYYPFMREEAAKDGLSWREDDGAVDQYMGPDTAVPDDSAAASDDLAGKILRCEASGRLYKLLPQELAFYRRKALPIPRRGFDERHRDRMALRNPRRLWSRQCMKCKKAIETTFAPDRPEIVYCEECFLSAVH